MEPIYEAILSRLSEITALKWIDLDKGQLELYETRPPVSFPCALIGMQITRTHKISHLRQRCDLMVTIRLSFDFNGNTSQITPVAARKQNLQYFSLADEVFNKLHGWGQKAFNEMERQALREERRPDGLKVISIPFMTSFVQDKK